MKRTKFHPAVAAVVATLLIAGAALAQRPETTGTGFTPPEKRARPTQLLVPPPADLQIVKSVERAPHGGSPGVFLLVVTNLGPGLAPGPIVVNDTLTGPATVVASSLPCSGINTASVSCSLPGPLNAGQSASITLTVAANPGSAGMVQNCATVSSPNSKDPRDQNNRDCSCMDFKRCFDTTVDVSTGTLNGTAIAIGANDTHWTVKPPNGTTAPAVATNSSVPPWVVPPAGTQWISSSTSANAAGTYTYTFNFNLGNEWPNRTCTLNLRWAVDNDVTLSLDNASPFASSSPPNSFTSFNTLHSASTSVTPSTGTHSLVATVKNSSGPTALLVVGRVDCVCRTGPVPNNPQTSTQ